MLLQTEQTQQNSAVPQPFISSISIYGAPLTPVVAAALMDSCHHMELYKVTGTAGKEAWKHQSETEQTHIGLLKSSHTVSHV